MELLLGHISNVLLLARLRALLRLGLRVVAWLVVDVEGRVDLTLVPFLLVLGELSVGRLRVELLQVFLPTLAPCEVEVLELLVFLLHLIILVPHGSLGSLKRLVLYY